MNDFKNQSPWGSPPPGGGGNGNGGFRRGPTPPNIDEILKKLQNDIDVFSKEVASCYLYNWEHYLQKMNIKKGPDYTGPFFYDSLKLKTIL